jgi:hypothetical protein
MNFVIPAVLIDLRIPLQLRFAPAQTLAKTQAIKASD